MPFLSAAHNQHLMIHCNHSKQCTYHEAQSTTRDQLPPQQTTHPPRGHVTQAHPPSLHGPDRSYSRPLQNLGHRGTFKLSQFRHLPFSTAAHLIPQRGTSRQHAPTTRITRRRLQAPRDFKIIVTRRDFSPIATRRVSKTIATRIDFSSIATRGDLNPLAIAAPT
jgi:hypothetical protein